MPEIDDATMAKYHNIQKTLAEIARNPKAAKLFEQAHKEVDASAQTPNLDRDRAVQEPLDAAMKRIDELETKLKTRDEESEKQAKLSGLEKTIQDGMTQLRREGWQEDGLKKVDELMKEKSILDPLVAAAYVEKSMPPQQTASPSGIGSWSFIESVQDGEADLKKLVESRGQSEPLADKMAREALAEVRGQQTRR